MKQPVSFENIYGGFRTSLQPILDKYSIKATMSIIQVPVCNVGLFKIPTSIKRLRKLEKRWHFVLFNTTIGKQRELWLRPSYSSLDEMIQITKKLVNKHGSKAVLCMMFHMNEYHLNTSPYSLTQSDLKRNISRLEEYLDWLTKNYLVDSLGLSEVVL